VSKLTPLRKGRLIPLREGAGMPQKTKTIERGKYDIIEEEPGPYKYRTINYIRGGEWILYKKKRTNPLVLNLNGWIMIEGRFRTKYSAVEYAYERIEEDKQF
jgi:hypothetical protein